MRLILAAAVVLLCAGFPGCGPLRRPEPPQAQCAAQCFLTCVEKDGDTGVRWTVDPTDPGAFDTLAGDVVPGLAAKLRTCDAAHRGACVQCLRRLDRENVIRLPAEQRED